jgi:membrane protein DedA with SNARE-associated domain
VTARTRWEVIVGGTLGGTFVGIIQGVGSPGSWGPVMLAALLGGFLGASLAWNIGQFYQEVRNLWDREVF